MKKSILALTIVTALAVTGCSLNDTADNITADKAGSVLVTQNNYAKAESQKMFEMNVKRAGGVNKFFHYGGVPTLEQHAQIVRSNNDTVYSTAVIDTSKGATITLPDVGDRYISILEVDQNHYTQDMQYGKGVKTLKGDTKHVFVIVRIGTIDGSKEDIAAINKIQSQMKITAGSASDVEHVNYDKTSHEQVHKSLQASFNGDYTGAFGEVHEVNFQKHLEGSATGWGGADAIDNIYQGTTNFKSMACHSVTFEDPKNKAFWSVTVYNKDIYVFSDNAHVSSTTAEPNKDGSYTVRFGCDGQANNIDIKNSTGEWTPMFRHYQPSKLVSEGKFNAIDDIKPVK